MTKTEEIVTKLSRDFQKLNQLVRGNGDIKGSLLGRLNELESDFKTILQRLDEIAKKPCREPCIFEEWQTQEEDMRAKKRTFRIGDIANYIQLAVLLLIAYGMFIQ